MGEFKSTSDDRVRVNFRVLSDEEKAAVDWFTQTGAAFIAYAEEIKSNGTSPREMALAITKVEEAVMWAVKGVTA